MAVDLSLERVWQTVFQASWQAGVIALLVMGIQATFGRVLSAGWRYALWLPVAIRLMMPAVPESSWSLFNLKNTWQTKPTIRRITVSASIAPTDFKASNPTPRSSAPALEAPANFPSARAAQRKPLAFW